ncbi:hypothetical protein LC724_16125 [Blautia sp. RD014234]|nr:hypothetical protein [Blautia parvula]
MGLTLVFAIPLGILCALRQNKFIDYIGRLLAMTAVSMPGFWVSYLPIIALALKGGSFRWQVMEMEA